jgi:anaerobic ribonucleoside-triphosphate reductase activating protein
MTISPIPPLMLSVSRINEGTTVLGPGRRAVVWVRGCPLRCTGCIAEEDLPFDGGTPLPVGDLARRFNALPAAVTGVTISGGEPMAQAGALVALVDLLRSTRDWSVMSYTGFTLEHLRRHGDAEQKALLDRLDILVDGPYVRSAHAALRWRGSSNQRLHYLSERHAPCSDDSSAGLEFDVTGRSVIFVGVPPVPDLRARFEAAMAAEGVDLRVEESTDVRKP